MKRATSPTRLAVERLEDRATPASTITVIPALAGVGSLDGFLTGSGGIVAVADGGSNPGTLSTGALASVAGANNISVTAQSSITFNDLAAVGGTLALQTAAGRVASFTASGGSLTFLNPAAN